MGDYARLAGEAKSKQDAAILAAERQRILELDSPAFFQTVEAHIRKELSLANAELSKRGLTSIGYFDSPPTPGRVTLVSGTKSLCTVSLKIRDAFPKGCQIVIEVELIFPRVPKVEFVLEQDSSGITGRRWRAGQSTAAEIAQTVVSGIVRGHFE